MNRHSLFLIPIGAAVLLAGCSRTPSPASGSQSADTLRTATLADSCRYQMRSVFDTTQRSEVSMSVSLELPEGDAFVPQLIRKQIVSGSIGRPYVNDDPAEAIHRYVTPEFLPDTATGSGYLETISGRFLLRNAHVANYRIDKEYYYERAAHGMYGSVYLVFEAQTGFVETELELFGAVDPVNLSPVTELLKAHLPAGVKESVWLDQVRPNGNFEVRAEGVAYHFNPYEITPYYIGRVEVLLPRAELRSLIQPASPVYAYFEELGW